MLAERISLIKSILSETYFSFCYLGQLKMISVGLKKIGYGS